MHRHCSSLLSLCGRVTFYAGILILVFIGSDIPTRANDSAAQLSAGGLVLARNDAIEMRSEELFISRSKVDVRYVFLNTGGRDTTIRVAFPLPPIGGKDFLDQDVAIPSDDPDNFLGFSTRVDGKQVAMEIEQKALANGRDVAPWLRSNGVPFNPLEGSTAQAVTTLSSDKLAEATRLGIVDGSQRPAWQLHTTYHWMQRFRAGVPLAIEHQYTPSVGGTVLSSLGHVDLVDDSAERYCVDPPLMKALQVARRQGRTFAEERLDYVLVTGANWKRPIGSFRLTIDKERPDVLVSFCGKGVRKISPTRFELTRKDWRPDRDLALLFLTPHKD
jgi:hypothetical protein